MASEGLLFKSSEKIPMDRLEFGASSVRVMEFEYLSTSGARPPLHF